jgi:hypothetical protein
LGAENSEDKKDGKSVWEKKGRGEEKEGMG